MKGNMRYDLGSNHVERILDYINGIPPTIVMQWVQSGEQWIDGNAEFPIKNQVLLDDDDAVAQTLTITNIVSDKLIEAMNQNDSEKFEALILKLLEASRTNKNVATIFCLGSVVPKKIIDLLHLLAKSDYWKELSTTANHSELLASRPKNMKDKNEQKAT